MSKNKKISSYNYKMEINLLSPKQKRAISILRKRQKKLQSKIDYIQKHGEAKVKLAVEKRQKTNESKHPLPNYIKDDTKPVKKSHEERLDNYKKKEQDQKKFHITADIHQTLSYTNGYEKKYKQDELPEKHRMQMVRESQVIESHDLATAQQKFKDIVTNKYIHTESKLDSYGIVHADVDSIEFLDVIDESDMKDEKPEKMFLKKAHQMDFNYIKEYKAFLNDDDYCVENNLVGIYGKIGRAHV